MSNKDYDATDQDNISKTDDEDDGKHVITEYALLYTILKEYGIVVGEWYPKMWKHIYEDSPDTSKKMKWGDCYQQVFRKM